MKFNTTGKTAEAPKKYVKEAGKYLFKIEKFEDDGYDNDSNQKLKIHFVGQKIDTATMKLSEDVYIHSENNLSSSDNLLWRVIMLRDALKSPENFEIEDWVGRYIIADIYMKKSTISDKEFANVSGYTYSKQNDKLPPIPEAKDEAQEAVDNVVAVESIDEDEIPFAPIGLQYPNILYAM